MSQAVVVRYLRAVLAAVSLAVTGLASHAAVYTGTWDPAFGPPFDTPGSVLRWKGSATFAIPDSCLAQPNGNYSNSGPCAGLSVLGAQVVLFNFDTNAFVDVLNFDPLSFTVMSVDVTGGDVTGLDSDPSDPVTPGSTFAGINFYNFYLDFDLTGVTLSASSDVSSGSSTADITFTRVPEPGTLALVGGALLVVGLARRRRSLRTLPLSGC